MKEAGLFDIDRQGDKFTWFNKHSQDPIHSCIDRVIGNLEWINKNQNKIVCTMELGISYHALICIKEEEVRKKGNKCFKFINVVTQVDGYQDAIKRNWQRHVKGPPPPKKTSSGTSL